MNFALLALLFCCAQVSAESSTLDVNDQYQQDLEREKNNCAENGHRLHEQYLAHFSTLDLALRIIDISLPVFEKREQELEREVAKSRQLQISLQEEMSQLQNSTADEDTKHLEEKMGIEEAILKLMLQIVQLGSELRFLKLEKEYISTNNKIVLEKQTELETSLLDLQSLGAPLENIETHLTKQLEQAQESLRAERKMCQSHQQMTSKFIDIKLKYVESLSNLTISNLNSRVENGIQKLNESLEQNLILISQLEISKDNERQLVLANNLTISNLNSRVEYGNQKLNESLEQNQMLISQLEIAKDSERQLVLANNLTISNLNSRVEYGNQKLNESLEQNQMLISQLEIAKDSERHLVLGNNLTIYGLKRDNQIERQRIKDALNQNQNLRSQLEFANKNNLRMLSRNNATLSNLIACNDATNKKEEDALNQIQNLESNIKFASINISRLTSSLIEMKTTNNINKWNLVECYKLYNICSVKEADSTQRNENITRHLKNCEKSISNLSSKNTRIAEGPVEKSSQFDDASRTITTTARPMSSVTPPEFVTWSTGSYFFNTQKLNWTSAREHCQSLGMDLVAIETELENVAIANLARKLLDGWSIWTSGCYSSREDAVVWLSTGHKVSYTNWETYVNNGNLRDVNRCIIVHPSIKTWLEVSINVKRRSICEKI